MKCDGCGAPDATFVRRKMGKDIDVEECDRCGKAGSVGHPDIYFREPYLDEHLVDLKNSTERHGVWIASRREKAERMKRLGVIERGDRRHGA